LERRDVKMVHYTIRARMNNLAIIREWIKDKTKEELKSLKYRRSLVRKCMVNIGVTKRKAWEYITLVLGDE